jgi:DNA-binding GntR family transcriptional regulator
MTRRPEPPPLPAEAQDVARLLGEDIIFGRLAPGSRLVEDPLMARFGATRHGVRRALAELERIGIVVREKNKGASVRALAATEVQQIYEVRELLQRQAALRIPLPADTALVAALEALQRQFVAALRAGDHGTVHRINDEFHLTLFGGCGNPYLIGSIRHYMWLSLPVRAQRTAAAGHAEAAADEHLEMIRLLKGSDNAALAELCVAHLQLAKREYLEVADHQR